MPHKILLLLCAFALALLAGCASAQGYEPPPPPEGPSGEAAVSEPASTPAPEPALSPEPTPTPAPTPALKPVEPYEFGTPLEESAAVEDDSFLTPPCF